MFKKSLIAAALILGASSLFGAEPSKDVNVLATFVDKVASERAGALQENLKKQVDAKVSCVQDKPYDYKKGRLTIYKINCSTSNGIIFPTHNIVSKDNLVFDKVYDFENMMPVSEMLQFLSFRDALYDYLNPDYNKAMAKYTDKRDLLFGSGIHKKVTFMFMDPYCQHCVDEVKKMPQTYEDFLKGDTDYYIVFMPIFGEKSAIRSLEIAAAVNQFSPITGIAERYETFIKAMTDSTFKSKAAIPSPAEYTEMFKTDLLEWAVLGIKPETPQVYTFQKKTVIPDIDEVQ